MAKLFTDITMIMDGRSPYQYLSAHIVSVADVVIIYIWVLASVQIVEIHINAVFVVQLELQYLLWPKIQVKVHI